MTKVKICGLTHREDIDAVNALVPDYIGFVFAKSRRQVDLETAFLLKSALCREIKSVGVFVDETVEKITAVVKANVLDAIQLHGKEDSVYIDRLRAVTDLPIIKAVRVQSSGQIQQYDRMPCDFLLLDTFVPGEQGGSGKSFDWSVIPNIKKPYFLAGGLDSQNVFRAVESLHPYCVDVSSGVETDGIKDSGKIAKFIKQVRSVR